MRAGEDGKLYRRRGCAWQRTRHADRREGVLITDKAIEVIGANIETGCVDFGSEAVCLCRINTSTRHNVVKPRVSGNLPGERNRGVAAISFGIGLGSLNDPRVT